MATRFLKADEAYELALEHISHAVHLYRQALARTPTAQATEVTLLEWFLEAIERLCAGEAADAGLDAMDSRGLFDLVRRKALTDTTVRTRVDTYVVATPDGKRHDFPIYEYSADQRFGTDEIPGVGFQSPRAAIAAASLYCGIPPGGTHESDVQCAP